MSTPTLEVLEAAMRATTDDVLRMCADIESNLAAQQAMLARLRRILESHGVGFPPE